MASFVIGDIHGCRDELASLVAALPLERADRLIFLGDYIDRGQDSKGVVSYLIELQSRAVQEIVFLKGNHEDMFLSYLGLPGRHGDMFIYNGGGPTLASYGISPTRHSPQEAVALVPPSHLEFFRRLRMHYLAPPFFCVHAGINPDKTLEEQEEEELLWIRDQFLLSRHTLPYTVLFGHTPQEEVMFHLPYKIGLDTGLVYGNKLSCLELEEKILFQIDRGKKRVVRRSVESYWKTISR
jgi:serine/threonine protein phosphatase 1